MHANISQGSLADAISAVIRAVPSRPSHPVLAGILFVADEERQQVRLTGFNLSLGIRISMDAKVLREGAFAFPATLLQNIVSKIPNCDLEIKVSEEVATICCQCGSYEIRGLDFSEFPLLPEPGDDDCRTIVLPQDTLINGFKNTIFAASPDEAKQVLAGVNLRIQKNSLEFAATDAHKLAVVNVAISENPETLDEQEEQEVTKTETEIVIPRASCEEILRQLSKNQQLAAIEIKASETICSFKWKSNFGEVFVCTRLIAGQYPDYPKLIDPEHNNVWSIDSKQLLDTCDRVSLFSLKKPPIIVMSVEKDLATISANSDERGSGSEKVPISKLKGDSIEIGFNAQYLTELLTVINSRSVTGKKVLVKSNHPLRPIFFELEDMGGITFLMMPVQLRHLQAVA